MRNPEMKKDADEMATILGIDAEHKIRLIQSWLEKCFLLGKIAGIEEACAAVKGIKNESI